MDDDWAYPHLWKPPKDVLMFYHLPGRARVNSLIQLAAAFFVLGPIVLGATPNSLRWILLFAFSYINVKARKGYVPKLNCPRLVRIPNLLGRHSQRALARYFWPLWTWRHSESNRVSMGMGISRISWHLPFWPTRTTHSEPPESLPLVFVRTRPSCNWLLVAVGPQDPAFYVICPEPQPGWYRPLGFPGKLEVDQTTKDGGTAVQGPLDLEHSPPFVFCWR